MDAVKESAGNDWQSVFKKLPDRKEEEIILEFLRLPFLNLSNLFLLEEKQVIDRIGGQSELKLLENKQNIKGYNPLEPHVI